MTTLHNNEAVAYIETLIAGVHADYFQRLTSKLHDTYVRYATEMVRTIEQVSAALPRCAITLRPLVEEYTAILRLIRDDATLPRNLTDMQIEVDYLIAIRALNTAIRKRLEGHLREDDLRQADETTERWLADQAAPHNQLYDLAEQSYVKLVAVLQDALIDIRTDTRNRYTVTDVVHRLRSHDIHIS